MKGEKNKKIVVVAGDLTIDWHLASIPPIENEGSGGIWWKDTYARFYQQRGGAALLADLIARVADELGRMLKL